MEKLVQYALFNDEFVASDKLQFPLMNRAFQYGDGLFETIKLVNGMPCFLSLHLDRLKKGMDVLKMKKSWTNLTSDVFKLIDKNKFNGGGYIKILVFRNTGGKYAPTDNTASYVIYIMETEPQGFWWNKKGMNVGLYEEVPKSINAFQSFKSLNCYPSILAGIYKNETQLDECIILNDKGRICESISSNVFLVMDDVLLTPSLKEGCVEGVMRKIVLSVAKKNKIVVKSLSIKKEALEASDEIFLTNVTHGIRWVAAYKKKRYVNKISRTIYELINAEVKKSVQLALSKG